MASDDEAIARVRRQLAEGPAYNDEPDPIAFHVSEAQALLSAVDAARAERDEARARAEAAERVVEAVRAWREMYEGAAPLETWARLQRLLAALTSYDNQRGER